MSRLDEQVDSLLQHGVPLDEAISRALDPVPAPVVDDRAA